MYSFSILPCNCSVYDIFIESAIKRVIYIVTACLLQVRWPLVFITAVAVTILSQRIFFVAFAATLRGKVDFWPRANRILYNLMGHQNEHSLVLLRLVSTFHSLNVLCIYRERVLYDWNGKKFTNDMTIIIWTISRLIDFVVVYFLSLSSPSIYKLITSTKWRGKITHKPNMYTKQTKSAMYTRTKSIHSLTRSFSHSHSGFSFFNYCKSQSSPYDRM